MHKEIIFIEKGYNSKTLNERITNETKIRIQNEYINEILRKRNIKLCNESTSKNKITKNKQ